MGAERRVMMLRRGVQLRPTPDAQRPTSGDPPHQPVVHGRSIIVKFWFPVVVTW